MSLCPKRTVSALIFGPICVIVWHWNYMRFSAADIILASGGTTSNLALPLARIFKAGSSVGLICWQCCMENECVLCCVDLQQPLTLRSMTRKHARDASYTGSALLTLLDHRSISGSLSNAAASLGSLAISSRSQSLAVINPVRSMGHRSHLY